MTPRATLSGEQLNRKWHQLNGWKVDPERSKRLGEAYAWYPNDPSIRDYPLLPQLHTDANLAIAEADRVFRADGWLVEQHQGETKICADEHPITVKGTGQHAFCEAILRALIASKEPAEKEVYG